MAFLLRYLATINMSEKSHNLIYKKSETKRSPVYSFYNKVKGRNSRSKVEKLFINLNPCMISDPISNDIEYATTPYMQW